MKKLLILLGGLGIASYFAIKERIVKFRKLSFFVLPGFIEEKSSENMRIFIKKDINGYEEKRIAITTINSEIAKTAFTEENYVKNNRIIKEVVGESDLENCWNLIILDENSEESYFVLLRNLTKEEILIIPSLFKLN